jgi:ArsR family transcriptional regulator
MLDVSGREANNIFGKSNVVTGRATLACHVTWGYPMRNSDAAGRADLLKVLSHPTRLAILAELLKGVKCVNDMAELLARPQANVSQHLMALRESGLVECRHDGLFRCYYLTRPGLVHDLLEVLGKAYPVIAPSAEELARAREKGRRRRRRRRAGRAAKVQVMAPRRRRVGVGIERT